MPAVEVPGVEAEEETGERRPGVAFWATAAIGVAIVWFGVAGLLANEPRGATSAIQWFVGGAVLMDLVVVPIGAVLGWVGKRTVAEWAWPMTRTALFTSAILIVFALPLVLDEGGVPANPTVRPRNYAAGLTWSLVAVWTVAAVCLLVRSARLRRGRVAPSTAS